MNRPELGRTVYHYVYQFRDWNYSKNLKMLNNNNLSNGGEGGIRTPGRVTPTTDFESVPFDHSGTSPSEKLGSKGLLEPLQGSNGDFSAPVHWTDDRFGLE